MAEICEGDIVGNYCVIRPLGRGGMGAVYEVEHLKLGVRYAMKTFDVRKEHGDLFRKRFNAEGKMLARLNHPNLVRVIDLEIDEKLGVLYFVMDLVLDEKGEARTLADVEPGSVDEDQIRDWFGQLCDALDYIHSRGIVHRDIKLNNILIASDRRVILSDFGISKITDDKLRTDIDITKTLVLGMSAGKQLLMGTPGYIAPEIKRGQEASAASDVYSLAVAFFHLLTNVWYDVRFVPKAGCESRATMNLRKLLEPFEYRWMEVLPAMLSADPAERPSKLAELSAQLEARAKAKGEGEEGGEGRRWLMVAAVAAIFLSAGAGVWWWVASGERARLVDDLYEIPAAASEE